MSQIDRKLDEANSKLDEINRKLDGPSILDEIGTKFIIGLERTVSIITRNICFAGRAKREMMPKWMNNAIDIIGITLMIVGALLLWTNDLKFALPAVFIGVVLFGSSPNRRLVGKDGGRK